MADGVKQILQTPIQLADQVAKLAQDVHTSYRADCDDLKSKTERLAALLRQAARADLYERPTRRIMEDTQQVLGKALSLVSKCRAAQGIVKRVFTIIPAAAFKKMSSQLDNSIVDVSWLLRVSATRRHGGGGGDGDDDDDDGYLGLPPIASNEPILCLIWEQIAKLHNGSLDDRADAASSLVSLACDNDRNGKLIIEEGGVGPLLKLVKEGHLEGQETAARAIGLLGRDPESVDQMIHAGVCSIFAKVLKEGPMKVQAMVAWAVSELAVNNPKCQDLFAQNVIRLLVGHLAFETVQEHSKYTIPSKAHMSIHSVVLANNSAGNSTGSNGHGADDDRQHELRHPLGGHSNAKKNQMHAIIQSTMAKSSRTHHPVNGGMTAAPPAGNGNVSKQHYHNQQQHVSQSGASLKGRELEDPTTKAYMKEMAARALWLLAKENPAICKSITESKALLCFAALLEKGPYDVQYNSAMALMEIAKVAEKDADLRRSAFKPNSPAAKAVLDQMLKIVEKGDSSDLLLPCITTVGCLSRTFQASETRIIAPLVRLLDDRDGDIMREAVIALTKFACDENYLHLDHSKAIIEAGGAKHLVQLVYLGERVIIQNEALVLLCYITHHVPDNEALAQAEVPAVLEWSSKQAFMVQNLEVERLLTNAKGRLELYQSRRSRPFH